MTYAACEQHALEPPRREGREVLMTVAREEGGEKREMNTFDGAWDVSSV
jgi:hypothetical protein